MTAYFDTSALFKLAVPESGTEAADRVWDTGGAPFASLIGYTELHAALGRAVRDGRDVGIGWVAIEDLWGQVTPVAVDAELVRWAARLAVRYGLRTLDAVHLASALVIAKVDAEMAFVTFDARLRTAAAAEGFLVLPVVV